ncbi:MAG: septal ring lytic transglycosylase RlpA family protein, partial [Solirubrobacterales bacterium]|nr:septal ring lytic transglycosylase RlpA family protein [Solirubrobacterales bacterium]
QAGAQVALQALRGRRWRTTARARTGPRGRFALHYVPRHDLSELVQLRFVGNAAGRSARRRLGRLNVYRPVMASWYGGGGGLACGGVLSAATMGVASRTLPCGTELTLRYGARTVRVPVVDRGPYVEGRELDLTEATKRALGFDGLGIVWSTR